MIRSPWKFRVPPSGRLYAPRGPLILWVVYDWLWDIHRWALIQKFGTLLRIPVLIRVYLPLRLALFTGYYDWLGYISSESHVHRHKNQLYYLPVLQLQYLDRPRSHSGSHLTPYVESSTCFSFYTIRGHSVLGLRRPCVGGSNGVYGVS